MAHVVKSGIQTVEPHPLMITLTRLNGSKIYANPDLLWMVESTPDTVVTFTNNEKLLVKESPDDITEQYVAIKQRVVVRSLAEG